jgi:endonuclease/exonuclease/phosphatase family metal-dependent hydrolase
MTQIKSVLSFVVACIIHIALGASVQCPNIAPQQNKPYDNIFKIATFNTLWLFDGIGDKTAPWKSKQDADAHVQNVASIIQTINATIINLVEVESCEIISRLITNGNYLPYLIPGTDTATRQNVALLSRITPTKSPIFGEATLKRVDTRVTYPIPQSTCGMKSSPSSSTVSKNYWTYFEISLPGDAILPLILFSIHFKAIPTEPKSCAQREAQAVVVRDQMRILRDVYANRTTDFPLSFVLVGDFNDFDNATLDSESNKPTSSVFDILRDVKQVNLTNVLQYVPVKERYSHWWDINDNNHIDSGELSLLDHVLISSHLLPMLHRVKIHNDLYKTGNLSVSDHWPISIELDLSKWREQEVRLIQFGKASVLPSYVLLVLCVAVAVTTLFVHFVQAKKAK